MRYLVFLMLVCQLALGDCDWKKIKDNGDGTYTYSKDLHICVGQLVQDSKVAEEKVTKLTKSIEMKDLAIEVADKRTQNWIDTSAKLEDRIHKIDEYQSSNKFLYFAAGVLAASLIAFSTAQLVK